MDIIKSIYANKLTDDDRDPFMSFQLPPSLGHFLPGETTKFHVLGPDVIRFYSPVFAMFTIQTIVAVILATIMYQFIILPRKKYQQLAASKTKENIQYTSSLPFIVGYGIIIPIAVLEPLYLKEILQIENVALRMASLCLTLPVSLRTIEAIHECTPVAVQKSRRDFIIYISCLLGPTYVDNGSERQGEINYITKTYMVHILKKFSREYILITILMSIMAHYDYEPFPTRVPFDSLDHTIGDMFSLNQLMNNLLAGLLLSVGLSQSTIGLSLYYALIYRVQTIEVVMNPFFESASPSDFWGRRWNRFIHDTLKNGIFKPVRKNYSKFTAVAATFLVSGLLHELVNYTLFEKRRYDDTRIGIKLIYGKNMIFFGWNAVLIILEMLIGKWMIFNMIKRTLPKAIVSLMVVMTALPVVHLFVGDWIYGGYFQHVQFGEFIIVPIKD